jgi:hypothetical protein
LTANFGDTCNNLCASHGAFVPGAADYASDPVSAVMNPEFPFGGDWQALECLADTDVRWGRVTTMGAPTGNENHPACRYYCPCSQ